MGKVRYWIRYVHSKLACVAGVNRGRGRGNLGARGLAYFVKCWRTLVRLKPCSDLPRLGNVKKNHKKRAMHGQMQGLFGFYQSYSQHLLRWYPLWNTLPRQLYFAYLAVFFSHGCRAWHRNLGLMIEKWAFRNFQGWPKKDKMGISCDSVSNIH